MADIYIGILLMVVLSVILFYVAFGLSRKCSQKISKILVVLVLGLLLISIVTLPYEWIIKFLPLSNAVIFANPTLLITAFWSGLSWKLLKGNKYKKLLFVISLLLVALYSSFGFLFRTKPTAGSRWKDGVCLQSSDSSCSAACAATLLKHYGIDATEKEMIELCLTRDNGTMLLGTYRGLKLKTKDSKFSVRLEKWNLDKLLNTKFPVIIQVELKPGANVDPRYARQWGWTPGVSHAVIFYKKGDGDKVVIADPSVGRENWRVEGIKALWHGSVLFLVGKD